MSPQEIRKFATDVFHGDTYADLEVELILSAMSREERNLFNAVRGALYEADWSRELATMREESLF